MTIPPSGNDSESIPYSGEYSGTDPFSEGIIDEDVIGPDVPRSPSDLPDMVKPTPSPASVADTEKQLIPEGIEAELSEGLSPDLFDKAKQLIDQYGAEEGLRRFREMDPDAARRFERGHPPQSPRRQGGDSGRDSP